MAEGGYTAAANGRALINCNAAIFEREGAHPITLHQPAERIASTQLATGDCAGASLSNPPIPHILYRPKPQYTKRSRLVFEVI